jgi:hypothetical protein
MEKDDNESLLYPKVDKGYALGSFRQVGLASPVDLPTPRELKQALVTAKNR